MTVSHYYAKLLFLFRYKDLFQHNPDGILFETSVVLKFHPVYNTKKDKVFKIQCFYPEKETKISGKLQDNRRGATARLV